MRALEFTRLIEKPVDQVKVDPKLDQALDNVEDAIEKNPGLLQKFKQIALNLKQKAQQVLAKQGQQGTELESVEIIEDDMSAIAVNTQAVSAVIKNIMANMELQSKSPQEVKTIEDGLLRELTNLARSERVAGIDIGDTQATERLNKFLEDYDTSIDGLVDKIMESERQWILANQDATTKKAQKEMATKEKNIDAVKRTIGGIFSGKLFKAGTLTDKQIQEKLLAFLIQAKDGIINWGKVLQAGKDKTANVDAFVPKEFKEIYLLFRKELFAVRPETTAGSWGPGEVGLILIGNPITKAKDAGDLQDKVTGDKFELKASNDPKKGGRLSPPGLGTSKMAPRFDRVKLKHFGKGYQAKFGEKSTLNKESLNQTFIKEYNDFIDKGLKIDSKEFLTDCIMAAFTDNVPTDKELEPYVEKMVVDNKIDYNGFVRTYAKFLFDRYQGAGDDKKFKNIIVFNPGSTTYTVLDGSDDLDSEFVVITGGIEFGGSQVPKSPQIGIA